MASLGSPSSPNSYQLRRGGLPRSSLNYIRRSSLLFRRNIRSLGWTVGASSVDGSGDASGEWMKPDKCSRDPFSGWSSWDSDSEKWPQFRGIALAAASGVILAAGLAFASMSLGKRSTAAAKGQMKPLTVQQEAMLMSENTDEADKGGNSCNSGSSVEDNQFTSNTMCRSEGNPGATGDTFPSEDHNGASSEGGSDEVTSSKTVESDKSKSEVVNPNNVDIICDDLAKQLEVPIDIDELPTQPVLNPSISDTYATVSDGSPGMSNLETINKHESSEMADTDTESGESIGTAQTASFMMPDVDPVSSLETLSPLEKIELANLHDDVMCTTGNELCQTSFTSELSLPLDLSGCQNTLVESYVITTTSTTGEPTSDLNASREEVPDPDINASGSTLDGNKSSEIADNLESSYGNEPYTSCVPETDRSSSFTVSTSPENAFSYPGIPAPSLVSAARQVTPGKVVVPPAVDQVQGQALAALQVLKVIEPDVQPSELCTRREFARWLVSASSALSRNSISKVYPAMYIENVTDLAFDDITPADPDFTSIQGLAEAGLISSKLSSEVKQERFMFSPESPLSRQDLVSWKIAVEKRLLPEVDKKALYQRSGFIDIDRISPDAWPALMADVSAGEQGITPLAFGFTRLFQPDKPVTKAQAAIALATGDAAEIVGEELARIEAESLADTAVAAHSALVAQVEKDLNASFERELAIEREKIAAVEKLAQEATAELEKIRAERDEETSILLKGRAAVESEVEVLSTLRHEVEEHLQSLMSDKVEISFERNRLSKLRQEAESESEALIKLQYELEVERKALSMARAWAEDEAKRAREHAKALEEARDRWEGRGIKVVVDSDLQDDDVTELTWLNVEKFSSEKSPTNKMINRGEQLVRKLEGMLSEVKTKSFATIERIIQKIKSIVEFQRKRVAEASIKAEEVKTTAVSSLRSTGKHLSQSTTSAVSALKSAGEHLSQSTTSSVADLNLAVKDGVKRFAEECKEGVDRISQKFKM